MIERTIPGYAIVALAVAALGMLVAPAPAFALSKDAQRIVDKVRANTPNLKPVCSDSAKLTTAVTAATIALAEAKRIKADEPSARAAGQEAGYYLYFHCS